MALDKIVDLPVKGGFGKPTILTTDSGCRFFSSASELYSTVCRVLITIWF